MFMKKNNWHFKKQFIVITKHTMNLRELINKDPQIQYL